jgi:hypothetical protein
VRGGHGAHRWAQLSQAAHVLGSEAFLGLAHEVGVPQAAEKAGPFEIRAIRPIDQDQLESGHQESS